MSALEMRGVAVTFGGSPIFEEASLVLEPGWTGLVGANGAGKTTLLRALAGVLRPSEGTVFVRPHDATIVLCPQEAPEPSTLSPGERKQLQIGAALAQDPDVLLLDEPTNHLDAAARAKLLKTLRRFRGIGIVVSHDREVLEELPSSIVRVHAGTVSQYQGAYSTARATWMQERADRESAHADAKRRVRVLEHRLDEARRVQASAAKSTSARARMKNARDHDAKDSMRKGRAAFADAHAGRVVASLRDAVQRIDVPAIERDRTIGGKVFAAYARASNPILFHIDAPRLKAGDRVILSDVRLSIGREERVRIAGPNGAGKTALLDALLATIPAEKRRKILHLPQELDEGASAANLDALREATDEERGRALSIFATLGSDPERIQNRTPSRTHTLSPGEARKLALACGLGMHAWALVLDEPTNHLDLPTIEKLERALVSFPGCLVLVTHDDTFAESVGAQTIDVTKWGAVPKAPHGG
jgi:ATPase subunit of ABC transporter with duplicated ATPase domains